MKTLSIWAIALCLAVSGCKKDDETTTNPTPAKPAENPTAKLVETGSYKLVSLDFSSYKGGEYGYVFSANADGKITQLGCQMPETGVYTVSLWDDNAGKLVRQKTVEQTAPAKATLATIDELVVSKDKRYVVTVNLTAGGILKKVYRLDSGTATLITYPKVVGNVLLVAPKYKYAVSTPTYPDGTDQLTNTFIFGIPDFTFIPN